MTPSPSLAGMLVGHSNLNDLEDDRLGGDGNVVEVNFRRHVNISNLASNWLFKSVGAPCQERTYIKVSGCQGNATTAKPKTAVALEFMSTGRQGHGAGERSPQSRLRTLIGALLPWCLVVEKLPELRTSPRSHHQA